MSRLVLFKTILRVKNTTVNFRHMSVISEIVINLVSDTLC